MPQTAKGSGGAGRGLVAAGGHRRHRHGEPETAAAARVLVDADHAAVAFHDAADDRQAQAGALEALAPGRPGERLEDVRALLLGHADAPVRDVDPAPAGTLRAAAH